MAEKYWVPAIEKASRVLNEIAQNPNQLRLVDISKSLSINKSSLFSLLHTLEALGWVTKEKGDAYTLGPAIGALSAAYFSQFNILQSFYKEAASSVAKINEHIQLGILEDGNVVYLGKMEGDSRVRLITDPGMRFPAYASAIGKMQLSQYTHSELTAIYPSGELEPKTPFTMTTVEDLYQNIQLAKKNGFAIENQEASEGFHCVAAPIYNYEKKMIAAVSFTIMTINWEQKKEEAKEEILNLSHRLSKHAGYTVPTNTK
ncbi:IclR family transcriptional regulator [Metabacillus arenae]|uniref:IclR family transcriptional regulator n=1 Tax=Metabacillus arenae TaxID=2771434 RepID=A0A926NJI9_9BACI|nr:IclR family transcriptional regulator [Metabacillus arenae]MBD1382869.1 IclR family transcriptional regulator [Metabacillus arenae]